MKIIVIWPYELKVSNRAHYPRLKALAEHYEVNLLTVKGQLIESGLKNKFQKIIWVPGQRRISLFLYPLIVLYTVISFSLRREEVVLYIFYNSHILAVMIASLLTGQKVFVDFLDDPYLSTEILKIEKRQKIKYFIYLVINKIFYYFTAYSNKIIGFSAIGSSRDSKLPQLYSQRYSIDPARLIVVPNGADLSLTYPRKARREKDELLRIIYVGIIGERRETPVLIENFSKIKELKLELILIGETLTQEDKEWIHKVAEEYKWISYKGALSHQEVLTWIDRSDVGVFIASKMVTNYRYTHPIKVLEYLAMAKPVIAPRFEGVKEIIRDGYNGILFDPDHPEELVGIIRKNAASFMARKFAENALESVKTFDWQIINKKFILDFQRILSLSVSSR